MTSRVGYQIVACARRSLADDTACGSGLPFCVCRRYGPPLKDQPGKWNTIAYGERRTT
jgi:hypothetical protein